MIEETDDGPEAISMSDPPGLDVLDPEECIELLGSVPIGRIVFTDGALPAVQPVNFVVHEGAVIVGTSVGSKLAAATDRAIVAFEVDEFDTEARTGWNVTVVGRAEAVAADGSPDLSELSLRSWLPGRTHYIRIPIEVVNGRRLRATGPPSADPAEKLNGTPWHDSGEDRDRETAHRHGLELEQRAQPRDEQWEELGHGSPGDGDEEEPPQSG